MATTTTNKRSISETGIDESNNPSKKRKLNEDVVCNSASSTKIEDKKNDNTAKSNTAKSNTAKSNETNDDNKDKTNDNENNNNSNNNNNDNKEEDVSNWTFKASDFTFGNNSWVKQTSNASDLSNDESNNESKTKTTKKIVKNDTNESLGFAKFEGLGFEAVLRDENSKDGKTESNGNSQDNKNGWGGAWSNSNPDGTFKLSFEWGSWENSKTKIDLNPSTKIGWESQATNFDPNTFDQDDKTKKVLEKMTGEQDSGDKDDEIKCKIRCKIYNLESGKYVERGQGVVKINTYKVKDDEDNDNNNDDNNDDNEDTKKEEKLKGRILCRRDQILTTLINAPILKDMKFEKVGNFIRFGVIELKKKNNENENKNQLKMEEKENKKGKKNKKDNKNKKNGKEENDKEENGKEENGKEENDKTEETEEDNDMDTEIKTYLMKPINKSQIETLLNAITEIQKIV